VTRSERRRPTDPAERLALGITGVNLAVFGAAVAWRPLGHGAPAIGILAGLGLTFALIGSLQMRLYFSQHRASFTLTDAVFVAGLFFAGPAWLGLAAGAGEILYGLANRRSPLKTVFNASSHAATAVVAASVFVLLGGGTRPDPRSWAPALMAAACWSLVNTVSMSAVISRAEGGRLERTLMKSVPTAAVTTAVAAPVGLLVVELLRSGPLYLLLLLPVAAGISFNNRYAATQRNEHLRVERLYETTTRTAQLSDGLDVVSTIAQESRLLVTGAAALCYVRDGSSVWVGRTARPGGVGPARAADIQGLLDQAADSHGTTLVLPVPDAFRALAPDAEQMMLARSPQGAGVDLILAVFRERTGGRRTETGVGETLAAFAAHGAAIAANAGLVGKLQRALASQLEANQRKDEFVATISHELRTPLTVLLGSAQTLLRLRDRIEATDRERLLRTAVDQGQRLKLLIEDLLLVAAAEQDSYSCQLVPVTTDDLESDLRQDVPDGHQGLVQFANALPGVEVLTDRYKVRQIVANLIQNSMKYAGGSPVEITIGAAGTAVSVTVVDHGPGIPQHDRDRVFDRFLQLDQSSTRSQGGTGLGLYICRKLAGQLDAQLKLEETPGGGCTFVLALPRRPIRRSEDKGGAFPAPTLPATNGMLRRPVLARPAVGPNDN
jgi:signal transduction histidine kinase